MNDVRDAEAEADLERASRVLRRARKGTVLQSLHIGVLLAELDAWLHDDRQWHHGEARHWRSLIDDLGACLRHLVTLSSPPIQQSLNDHAEDLDRLRKGFQKGAEPDDALRRQLSRLSDVVRADVVKPDLLVMGWQRVIDWADSDPVRAEDGVAALRDLAELSGHDAEDLFDRVQRVLGDEAWEIAPLRGDDLPDDTRARAGEPAPARLELAESLLRGPARRLGGVVWLEYLQAELRYPWTLSLGDHVTLYQHDFLRSMVHQAPNDERIPEDLRDRNALDLGWFDALDPEEAVKADHKVPGDPRVFLRLELPEMAPRQLLAEARETAEFLVAFGALGGDDEDLWVLSNSHLVRGWQQTTAATPVNYERAHDQLPFDVTAMHLARHADVVARHLPLRTTELRLAGRLLVWLRQAAASDDPAQVVLCDRVVEQVCGWAGVAEPWRFTDESLSLEWIYNRMRDSILNSYRRLRWSSVGVQELWRVIEPSEKEPPHAPRNYIGSTNLKAILENIDELAKIGAGLDAGVDIERLRQRIADGSAVGSWIDELGEEFKRRNARLRRTRNSLMHGGPLVVNTVDHVSKFAMSLAYLAIGPAVNMLLNERDLVDGFLDNQAELRRCFARLRKGAPFSEAFFLP